ncbi:MAG TPA: hypothetical protein VM529_21475 [Gemmata sp.]|nr:hypothetical protein [Gemmata sp.]
MKFGATRSQIFDAQKAAAGKWYMACQDWDDAVRREHGEQVVEELDKAVSETLRAIDLISTLFVQIRQECEFPGAS